MPSPAEVPVFSDLSEVYGADGERAGPAALAASGHGRLKRLACPAELEGAKARYQALQEAFSQRFQAQPELFARAPGLCGCKADYGLVRTRLTSACAGRVNLIGEHIDYEGYGVLPMAIRQV